MRIILLTQDISLQGGVANFFNVIKDKFRFPVDYFFTGSRHPSESSARTLFRFISDYYRYVQKVRSYDLVHLNTSLKIKSFVRDGLFLLLSGLYGKKCLLFIHGWDKHFEQKLEKYFLWLYKLLYFRADCILVLSSEFRSKLQEWGFDKPVFLFTTVVDDQLLNGFGEEQIRAKFLHPKDHLDILFLARLEKEKGVYILLDAFAGLQKSYPHLRLTIAGDGSEYDNARRYAEEQDIVNVVFPGIVQGREKKALLQKADIFCFPSYYGEGMPTNVLEALAFGLPVVTRAVGGLLDFFENGKMGYMTDSRDPEEFARLMKTFIEDDKLRQQTALYNHRYASTHFLASRVVAELEKVYREITE